MANEKMKTHVGTPSTKRTKAGGAPRGNRNALSHGLYSIKAMLNGDGLDKRTSLYRALAEAEKELVEALGGDPSPQELRIIKDTIDHELFAGSINRYLFSLKSLVRKGRVHPVLAERRQIGVHIRENLKTLGLKRVSKQVSLADYVQKNTEIKASETGVKTQRTGAPRQGRTEARS